MGDFRLPLDDVDPWYMNSCYWESYRCDLAYDEDARCLVVPPERKEDGPRPVLLFCGGNGYIDDREDFFFGGVDLLMRNSKIKDSWFVLAPKPMSNNGLLRWTTGERQWAEDAVYNLFTEVLRRLGPERVDTGRIFATGISSGAACVWHLVIKHGNIFQGVAPISGACEQPWPGNVWHDGQLSEVVMERFRSLAFRAYHIDIDERAGNPLQDLEAIMGQKPGGGYEKKAVTLFLEGMEPRKDLEVTVRRWFWQDSKVSNPVELWWVKGPLHDFAAFEQWGGDTHCLWYRVFPILSWRLVDFFEDAGVKDASLQWGFDQPPLLVDTREEKRRLEQEWKAKMGYQDEQRFCPDTGRWYSLVGLREKYAARFSEAEIQDYWDNKMASSDLQEAAVRTQQSAGKDTFEERPWSRDQWRWNWKTDRALQNGWNWKKDRAQQSCWNYEKGKS